MQQRPGPDGIARSRWAIVRNTYRELEDTTIKTWLDWFPESVFGPVNKNTMTHTLKCFDDRHQQTHELEILFRALDKPSDIKKLLSMELTGAWLNEAREIAEPIKDALETRLGRYPAKRDGGPTWHGLIMDTNPPDDDHWWYRLAEEDTPANHAFFRQPSGLSSDAENVENLPEGYYENLSRKGGDFVRVYVHGEYGYVQDGKPVYPEFSESIHVIDDYELDPRRPIVVGLDFGLVPAAVFQQQMYNDNWVVVDELVADNIATQKFARAIKKKLNRDFKGMDYEAWGDPSGDNRSASDKRMRSAFKILQRNGVDAMPAPDSSNNITTRLEVVREALSTLHDGVPRLRIHRRCKTLIKGMAGRYKYRRVNVGGGERFHDKPEKNEYSHVNDAEQYALLGAGESPTVNRKDRERKVRVVGGVKRSPLPRPGRTMHVTGGVRR